MTTSARFPDTYGQGGSANLADILERVLDKGVVIAGDIKINLLDIELLTIKLRLVVASVDRAKEMGIDWWESDPALSSRARSEELARENARLRTRLEDLERLERAAGSRAPEVEGEPAGTRDADTTGATPPREPETADRQADRQEER